VGWNHALERRALVTRLSSRTSTPPIGIRMIPTNSINTIGSARSGQCLAKLHHPTTLRARSEILSASVAIISLALATAATMEPMNSETRRCPICIPVLRGISRYTPTHAIQQEPIESAGNGNWIRLLSDGFVPSSRTITRTICATWHAGDLQTVRGVFINACRACRQISEISPTSRAELQQQLEQEGC
jgi:hypothetical protein